MSQPRKFALLGKSGAGKSEVGLLLSESTGAPIIKTGAICREIAKLLFGNDDKRTTQLLDDALTRLDDSIFLRAALRDVDTSGAFIIDSLRFASDFHIARDLEAVTIRVLAAPAVRMARLQQRYQAFDLERDGRHRSETELDEVQSTITIVNDGPRSGLKQQVDTALAELK